MCWSVILAVRSNITDQQLWNLIPVKNKAGFENVTEVSRDRGKGISTHSQILCEGFGAAKLTRPDSSSHLLFNYGLALEVRVYIVRLKPSHQRDYDYFVQNKRAWTICRSAIILIILFCFQNQSCIEDLKGMEFARHIRQLSLVTFVQSGAIESFSSLPACLRHDWRQSILFTFEVGIASLTSRSWPKLQRAVLCENIIKVIIFSNTALWAKEVVPKNELTIPNNNSVTISFKLSQATSACQARQNVCCVCDFVPCG